MQTHYNVKEMALRFASLEADTEAVTWFSGEWSARFFFPKPVKRKPRLLRENPTQCFNVRCFILFYTNFEASVSNITSLMSGIPQITYQSRFVLLTKTRHTFHCFYHQILVLVRQRLFLVTGNIFVNEYFSSSLTKLTLTWITWTWLKGLVRNHLKHSSNLQLFWQFNRLQITSWPT